MNSVERGGMSLVSWAGLASSLGTGSVWRVTDSIGHQETLEENVSIWEAD